MLTESKSRGNIKECAVGTVPICPPPPPRAKHVSPAESAEGVDGRFPAPIRNPEAWPPNYADGYNDALRLVTEEGFARPVAPSGVSDADMALALEAARACLAPEHVEAPMSREALQRVVLNAGSSYSQEMVAAAAASAQVREAEACIHKFGRMNTNVCTRCGYDAAPEPVPVAQGDMAHRLEGLAHALQRRRYPDNAKLIREAIADHARIVAELQARIERLSVEATNWYRAHTQAEASLAACRADAEKWRRAVGRAKKLTCAELLRLLRADDG